MPVHLQLTKSNGLKFIRFDTESAALVGVVTALQFLIKSSIFKSTINS